MRHDLPFLEDATLSALEAHADAADAEPDWPAASWQALVKAGAMGWCVPRQFGGQVLGRAELLSGSERLAGACLTTAFILSQRDAAVRRLVAHASSELQARLLPAVARGESFITVGLSQLTTSRQHRPPALVATPRHSSGYRLDGEIPWVTGADQAQMVVTGAALADKRQAVFLLPMDRPGVTVDPPMRLAALGGSRTTTVHCDRVELGPELLLAGPAAELLGTVGGGGLETSCLAVGLAGSAVRYIRQEAGRRPTVAPFAERFEKALSAVRRRMEELAGVSAETEAVFAFRAESTGLALRATQAALTVAKGAGFAASHPAQRWARQALFFLVWSCPQPITMSLLADLAPPTG
jgi:alkylation response protein AidB-like acyl-CoA dehydrogenase